MSEVASGVGLQRLPREVDAGAEVTTLVELFRRAVGRERNLLNYKKDGHWRRVSSRELESQVRAVAMGLRSLEVRPGDRVGILSENRVEWTMADLGVINCGALDAPIYATQAPKQAAYILNDAGVELLFISNQAQYGRMRDALKKCPKLRVIISFDPISDPVSAARVMSFSDLLARGRARDREEPKIYETLRESVRPESLATLIYTSGTTGEPKGVMLTHANLVSNALANFQCSDLKEGDVALTFLPFSHVLERTVIYMCLYAGVSIFYAQSVEAVSRDLIEVRPHFMTGVPRIFEKMLARAIENAEAKGEMHASIARWAVEVGKEWAQSASEGEGAGLFLNLKHKIVDALV